MRASQIPTGAAVEIRRVRGLRDIADARAMLARQRRWLEDLIGVDLESAEPAAVAEYADPAAYYAPPAGQLIVARVAGRPSGIVAVKGLGRDRTELKRLYVLPPARELGLGSRLVAEVIAVAAERGFSSLQLDTSSVLMAGAHRLYLSFGFRETAAGLYGVEHAIRMELELAAVGRAA